VRGCVQGDFLLVNLFREPLGNPVTPGAINGLFETLCSRAGLRRAVSPHMCRHAFAKELAELTAFKTTTISRMAAQHTEITRLRTALAARSNVRALPQPATPAPAHPLPEGPS